MNDQSELTELITEMIERLVARRETLATAESLTGGLIGSMITSVSGASAVYRGGVISYATDLKATLAGASSSTLREHGAVAAPTAAEMAVGVAGRCEASWGIAVTGVAGPDPQEGHPPGTVFIAVGRRTDSPQWGDPDGDSDVYVRELGLSGDRAAIRRQTAEAALRLAWQACSS